MKKSSELLVNASSIKNALGKIKCKPAKASDVIMAADSVVEDIVDKACISAKLNGRGTVMPVDIRPFIARSLPYSKSKTRKANDKAAAAKLKRGSSKVLGNHVYDSRVKDYMKNSAECNGGTPLKISGLSNIFLDAAVEDIAIKACKIDGNKVTGKTIDSLVM